MTTLRNVPACHHPNRPRCFFSEVYCRPRERSNKDPCCVSRSDRCLVDGLRRAVGRLYTPTRTSGGIRCIRPDYFYEILRTVSGLDVEFNKLEDLFLSSRVQSRNPFKVKASKYSIDDMVYLKLAAKSLLNLINNLKEDLLSQSFVAQGQDCKTVLQTKNIINELENKLYTLLGKLEEFKKRFVENTPSFKSSKYFMNGRSARTENTDFPRKEELLCTTCRGRYGHYDRKYDGQRPNQNASQYQNQSKRTGQVDSLCKNINNRCQAVRDSGSYKEYKHLKIPNHHEFSLVNDVNRIQQREGKNIQINNERECRTCYERNSAKECNICPLQDPSSIQSIDYGNQEYEPLGSHSQYGYPDLSQTEFLKSFRRNGYTRRYSTRKYERYNENDDIRGEQNESYRPDLFDREYQEESESENQLPNKTYTSSLSKNRRNIYNKYHKKLGIFRRDYTTQSENNYRNKGKKPKGKGNVREQFQFGSHIAPPMGRMANEINEPRKGSRHHNSRSRGKDKLQILKNGQAGKIRNPPSTESNSSTEEDQNKHSISKSFPSRSSVATENQRKGQKRWNLGGRRKKNKWSSPSIWESDSATEDIQDQSAFSGTNPSRSTVVQRKPRSKAKEWSYRGKRRKNKRSPFIRDRKRAPTKSWSRSRRKSRSKTPIELGSKSSISSKKSGNARKKNREKYNTKLVSNMNPNSRNVNIHARNIVRNKNNQPNEHYNTSNSKKNINISNRGIYPKISENEFKNFGDRNEKVYLFRASRNPNHRVFQPSIPITNDCSQYFQHIPDTRVKQSAEADPQYIIRIPYPRDTQYPNSDERNHQTFHYARENICPQTIECPGNLDYYPQSSEYPDNLGLQYCLQETESPDNLEYCPQVIAYPDNLVYCPQETESPDNLEYCPQVIAYPDNLVYCPQETESPDNLEYCPQVIECPESIQMCPQEIEGGSIPEYLQEKRYFIPNEFVCITPENDVGAVCPQILDYEEEIVPICPPREYIYPQPCKLYPQEENRRPEYIEKKIVVVKKPNRRRFYKRETKKVVDSYTPPKSTQSFREGSKSRDRQRFYVGQTVKKYKKYRRKSNKRKIPRISYSKYFKLNKTSKKRSKKVIEYDNESTDVDYVPMPLPRDLTTIGTNTEALPSVAKRTSTSDLIKRIRAFGTNTKQIRTIEKGIDPMPQRKKTPPIIIKKQTKFTNTDKVKTFTVGTEPLPQIPKPKMTNIALDPLYYLCQRTKDTSTIPERKKDFREAGTDPTPIKSIPKSTVGTDPLYYLWQKAKFTNTVPVTTMNAGTETSPKPVNVDKGTDAARLETKDQKTSYEKVKTFERGNDPISKNMIDKGQQFDTVEKKPKVKTVYTGTVPVSLVGKITQTTFIEERQEKPSTKEVEVQTSRVQRISSLKEPAPPPVLLKYKKSLEPQPSEEPDPVPMRDSISELSMHLKFEKIHEEIYKRRSGLCRPNCSAICKRSQKYIICEKKRSNTIKITNRSDCEIKRNTTENKSSPSVGLELSFKATKSPQITEPIQINLKSMNNTGRNTPSMRSLRKTKLSEDCGMNVCKSQSTKQPHVSRRDVHIFKGKYFTHKNSKSNIEIRTDDESNIALNTVNWKNIADKIKAGKSPQEIQ